MPGWPPLSDPALLERQRLDQDAFLDAVRGIVAGVGRRAFDPVLVERALGYPWERPERSYLLRDGEVELLDADPPPTAFEGRYPIVAIGSNGSPGVLAAKFAHLEDRDVVVLAGWLHDLDVGAAGSPTIYGVLPATPFASPGTAVRAAVLWLTPAQVQQLTWSEMTYRLGRLKTASFTMLEGEAEVGELYGYVSRFGSYRVDGAPVALAALPARERNAAALTQEELLADAARRVLGAETAAADLVRAIWEDMPALLDRIAATLWPAALHLAQEHFTPYPARP